MYYDGTIHIEEDDQCYTCEYFLKGVTCPLLEALALGVVNLEGDVVVQNCGFYRKFTRHLRAVPAADTPPTPDDGERKQQI
jgi:hypothetical protein